MLLQGVAPQDAGRLLGITSSTVSRSILSSMYLLMYLSTCIKPTMKNSDFAGCGASRCRQTTGYHQHMRHNGGHCRKHFDRQHSCFSMGLFCGVCAHQRRLLEFFCCVALMGQWTQHCPREPPGSISLWHEFKRLVSCVAQRMWMNEKL